ncbi:MAG TPA: hypothetical protein VM029_12035 [Opitutaceae bacterium]|nr:hypothetical protein [Opitutaceae bacterium]
MNVAPLAFAFLGFVAPLAAAAADVADADDKPDDVISLAAYNVKADRIEDFGLRVESMGHSGRLNPVTVWFGRYTPTITAIVPNTAAARAGLRPGELILKSEGQATTGGAFSTGKFGQWSKTQKKKWEEVAAGKKNVTWMLEVQNPITRAIRTVKLIVPTPPPHWGASLWRAPEGRVPATVPEPGPLAERARAVLDNGIWISLDWALRSLFGKELPPGVEPTAYEWHLENEKTGRHQVYVTQFRGRTDIVLATWSPATGPRFYLTSPSGVLEKAWRWQRPKGSMSYTMVEVPLAEAGAGFAHELDLWSTKVGKVSARWPFELKPGYDANAIFAVLAPKAVAPAAKAVRPLADDFLKLAPASEAEKALFADAYGKLGAEPDHWAYTETTRGLEDTRVLVTRVDPSRPEAERSVLLSIDGKSPTPAEVQRWRDDGGDTPKPLGDLPPLASLVDSKDLRIFKDEADAVVFELPMRGGNAEFPADKFQAHFRVNKTHRSLADITVKLRDSFRVAGVVKITEAGLHARFEMLDPAHPPQPVTLKAGGTARILLVKIARDFDTTRTDFKRVVPYVD